MRPETRLDSAAFQLTPTRTRCDLIVIANGRKEKIASGLLNPFVAHLKAAQDQIAKGGYTILLQPDPAADAPWFTRGTVERFVRFVSTPEVLERVTTIESEILQLEDAIAVQSNENLGLKSGEGHNGKPVDSSMEGGKTGYNTDGDKALVLYKPDAHPASPLQNDDGVHEEHSKVQLLRVLEIRKTVLRKEQAMAFARAVAAGFDIDNLIYLISFAERFGASRLMKACTQFIDLWRQKHETGQWIDVEPETMSARSEFPPFNASGIMFMGEKETMSVSNGDTNGEDAAKADHRAPHHPHEYHHGPYQSGYPPWAMHPPYPMQGMPPYYPGANPYYPPPYPPTDDPRYNHSERRPSRKHSADSKDFDNSDEESDDQSGSERESSHGRKSSKKGKRSGKKNVIVIRNVNVTSKKKHRSSESESHSGSDVSSEDSDDSHRKSSRRNHHKRSSSKKKGGKKTIESEDEYTKDGMSNGQQDGDQGNWNAFQNFLLRDEEKTRDNNDADMFASEREPPPPPRRRETTGNMDDPILLSERGSADVDERNGIPFNTANGRIRARQMMSGDELMMSGEGRSFVDGDMKEIEAGGGGYRRGANDDFMVYGHDNSMDRGSSLDPLAEGHYKRPTLEEKKNVHGVDESFMIPVSSTSHDNLGADGRTAIDIDAELGTSVQKTSDAKAGGELFYEPDELMPERGVEDVSFGYDPSMDYDSHMQIHPDVGVEDANAEDLSACVEDEGKMPAKDKKLRGSHEGLDKRRKDASARRLSAPKGPLTDAQKRAQNLRAYKAGLQKEKKELEAEQIKRLERLKQERQKRIAARSGASNPISTPPQAKAKPSPKVSPSTHKSSKFTDAEPGSSSPLRKIIPARSSTPGSDPHKTAKASKLGGDSSSAVSKSTSSLAEIKKEKSGRTESSIERLKKLAEPKSNASTDHPPNPKSVSSDYPRRRSLPEDVQTKKISAIMQLDETKSAALPELKVKSPRTPAAVVVKNKAAAKVTKEAPRGGPKAHATSESRDGKKSSNGKVSRVSSSDDNVVVEKTVVMLENEVVSTPPVVLPSGRSAESETRSDDRMENPSLEQEYIAIRAPPSPIDLPEDANPTIHTSDNQLNSYEVVPEYKKDELEKPAPLALMEEKPYEAPFARVTSLEDASSKTTAYNHHPLPAQEPETLARAASVRARVPEPAAYAVSAEETHGGSDKPRSKEPKGLRKLLKFGKKSHTSTMDSDASSVDEAPAGDGSMLKNLISQDDSAGSSYKASRSFSLLAPFRKNKVVVL
ncbi:COP1-interacting protein 7 isoform X2 [Triticum aestivum]|uniref:COP1-interacting protein 7 isoform X2 n=1 Tax=Triticum aestivum TaxID=4565 RepID=UPI001D013669|nr:COP1-interacting protein 7-like isoform X2 [Triticum aestivum]